DTRRPAQEHIAMFANVIARGQVIELLAVDTRVEGKVKGLERFVATQLGAAETQGELFLLAALDFIFQQAFQKVSIGPLFLDRGAHPDVERIENAGETQQFEFRSEVLFQFHSTPPRALAPSVAGSGTSETVGGVSARPKIICVNSAGGRANCKRSLGVVSCGGSTSSSRRCSRMCLSVTSRTSPNASPRAQAASKRAGG